MTIQALIGALPPAGGVICLPAGDFSAEPPIVMRDNVILTGQGPATIIPPVTGNGEARNFGFGLRDLIVNGAHSPGYAIDWRNVSMGQITHVTTMNCTYGLLLVYSAFYNRIEGLFANASVCGVEVYGGANQNTFIGGKFSAPKGINIQACNGTTLLGTALEWSQPNMVFKSVSGDDGATRAINVRQEDANHSSTYWNQ